jgi:hypothetical protein
MTPRQTRERTLLLAGALALAPAVAAWTAGCAPARRDMSAYPSETYRPNASDPPPTDGAASPLFSSVNTEVLSSEPWRYATAEGQILRTANYRVYTTTDNLVIRSRLSAFLEHALAHYRTALAPLPAPETRLDTYLMKNRPQWERVTKQLMGPQADSLLKIPRGGYASRGIGVYYDIGIFDTLAIAGHEGWHQYTQKVFREPLPVWLEEGIATYMEGHRWVQTTPVFRPWANVQRFDQLRKAYERRELLPLQDLLESRPQDFLEFADDRVLTFYAQLWALVHFLNEGEDGRYSEALSRLLTDAAEGRISRRLGETLGDRAARSSLASRTGPAVFMAYFNEDIDEAAAAYGRFVQALTQTGARGPIVEGRSPIASGSGGR